MFKFKSTLIALAITFLMLAGFVDSSDAFEIEKMEPNLWFTYEAYDYGYGGNHMVRLETSLPYYSVDWYVNDVHDSYSSNNFAGGNPGTLTFGNITGLTGSLAGTTYTIKALAHYAWNTALWDTDSYEVTVYKPFYTYAVAGKQTPDIPDVYGYAEITRYYRSGDDIILDYYADAFYAGNDKKKKFSVSTEVRNTIHGLDNSPPQGDTDTLGKDNFYFRDSGTVSASLSKGVTGRKYECEAYVRIVVDDGHDQDHYFRNYRVSYKK